MWCVPNIVHETVLQLSWDQGDKQVPYIKWIAASSLMWYYSFLEIMNDEYQPSHLILIDTSKVHMIIDLEYTSSSLIYTLAKFHGSWLFRVAYLEINI